MAFNFDEFCAKYGLKQETKNKLLKYGLNNERSLKCIPDGLFKTMDLSLGQEIVLKEAVYALNNPGNDVDIDFNELQKRKAEELESYREQLQNDLREESKRIIQETIDSSEIIYTEKTIKHEAKYSGFLGWVMFYILGWVFYYIYPTSNTEEERTVELNNGKNSLSTYYKRERTTNSRGSTSNLMLTDPEDFTPTVTTERVVKVKGIAACFPRVGLNLQANGHAIEPMNDGRFQQCNWDGTEL